MEKQKIGEQVVEEGVEKNEKKYGAENAALVAIDAKTGDIITMVGSRDYFDDEHDGKVNVATRLNQPGSSLKPLIYATAIEKGLTPDTILLMWKRNLKPRPRIMRRIITTVKKGGPSPSEKRWPVL